MYKRTYGWIQNPSNFDNLKLVVQIFDPTSVHYAKLENILVPQLIPFDNLRALLLKNSMKARILFSTRNWSARRKTLLVNRLRREAKPSQTA